MTGGKSDENDPIEVITRKQWGADDPLYTVPMETPVKHIYYSETDTRSCKTKAQCVELVKGIQKFHMSYRDLPDIQFHFLIGGDGNIYEGRGWSTSGIQYPKENHRIPHDMTGKCLEIGFIGSFKDEEPSELMIRAVNSLVHYALNNKLVEESPDDEMDETESDKPKVTEQKDT